ncbi:MAG: hypothetical protein ACREMY_25345, partial [bacterium]
MMLWILPGLFAFIYAIVGGIELLLPLFGALDRKPETQLVIGRWFSPVWEVTNVFFAAAVTAFAAIFPQALPMLPDRPP